MSKQAIENSVQSLVNLYNVIMGVALTISVTRFVDIEKNTLNITWDSVLVFIAFLVTFVPFYHGALRHLDTTYIESNRDNLSNTGLMKDFIFFVFHALAFVILAFLLLNANQFLFVITTVLLIDVAWGFFVVSDGSSKTWPAGRKWATINFFCCLSFGLVMFFLEPWDNAAEPGIKLPLIIMIICLLRSLIDYLWVNDVYFPAITHTE